MALHTWILQENVLPFCGLLAKRVGHSFYDGDEIAITHGLTDTDIGDDRWFEYPLAGDNHEVTLRLAKEPWSGVVSIEVDIDIDKAYCEGLVDVMQLFVVSRDPR